MTLRRVSRQACRRIRHGSSGGGSQAAATYEQVVRVVPEQEMLHVLVGSAGYYFGLGDLLREWNDLDEASRSLAQGMELVKGTLTVDANIVTQGYVALARLMQARGD